MGEIIKSVAEVIQSFLTINLLDSRSVLSIVDFDATSKKRVLSVKLKGSEGAVHCCMDELQKLRDNGIVMNVKIEERNDWSGNGDIRLEITANFYEQ